jgi:hypothetical protein
MSQCLSCSHNRERNHWPDLWTCRLRCLLRFCYLLIGRTSFVSGGFVSNDATFARPVWLSLLRQSATVQPQPFLLEKPLSLHTAHELERLVLKWQSSRAICTLAQPKEQMSPVLPTDAHLVEGGRRLLFGMCQCDGSVRCHDLNTLDETSDTVILVPTVFGKGTQATTLLSVDIDQDTPYMTFNLGIMSTYCDNGLSYRSPLRAHWIEVHRVTPHWDENGQVRSLQAERLICFPEEHVYDCDLFTLRGNHVAYSLDSCKPPINVAGRLTTIADWTLADSTSLAYPRKVIFHRQAQVSCFSFR